MLYADLLDTTVYWRAKDGTFWLSGNRHEAALEHSQPKPWLPEADAVKAKRRPKKDQIPESIKTPRTYVDRDEAVTSGYPRTHP